MVAQVFLHVCTFHFEFDNDTSDTSRCAFEKGVRIVISIEFSFIREDKSFRFLFRLYYL